MVPLLLSWAASGRLVLDILDAKMAAYAFLLMFGLLRLPDITPLTVV
jgi:hypothetical protein